MEIGILSPEFPTEFPLKYGLLSSFLDLFQFGSKSSTFIGDSGYGFTYSCRGLDCTPSYYEK
jgi:hypothetical protein